MSMSVSFYSHSFTNELNHFYPSGHPPQKYKYEKKFLKIFLIYQLHQLFCELFNFSVQLDENNSLMECYSMDSKMIQLLIQGIIETGEYTLEGIAYHTRIPLDILLDASCGQTNQLSITPWARVVDLYVQVKPEISGLFFKKLLEAKDKSRSPLSLLLSES